MALDKTDGPCRPFGGEEGQFYRRKGVVFDSEPTPEKYLEDIEKFEVRHDDIFIASVPRSGTHWLSEMILLVLADADPGKVNRVPLDQLFEMNLRSNPNLPKEAGYKVMENWPSSQPRVIITHLSAEFLPLQVWHTKGVKVLTIVRNPLDIFISQHKLYAHMLPEVVQEFPDFVQYSMTDCAIGGSWFHHVLSYWSKQQSTENLILYLKYEDAQRDIRKTVREVAEFLQRPLSVDQLDRMVELTSFEGMVNTYQQMEDAAPDNKYRTRLLGTTPFLDKGKVGTWKGKFSEKQLEQVKAKIKESFEGTGLSIELEI